MWKVNHALNWTPVKALGKLTVQIPVWEEFVNMYSEVTLYTLVGAMMVDGVISFETKNPGKKSVFKVNPQFPVLKTQRSDLSYGIVKVRKVCVYIGERWWSLISSAGYWRYSTSIDRSKTHSSSHNPRTGLSTSRSTVLPGLLCPVPVWSRKNSAWVNRLRNMAFLSMQEEKGLVPGSNVGYYLHKCNWKCHLISCYIPP